MVAASVTSQMAEHERSELGGERLDPLLQRVALVGQRDLGAGGVACLGDAPGDGTVYWQRRGSPALPCIRPEFCAIS